PARARQTSPNALTFFIRPAPSGNTGPQSAPTATPRTNRATEAYAAAPDPDQLWRPGRECATDRGRPRRHAPRGDSSTRTRPAPEPLPAMVSPSEQPRTGARRRRRGIE